MAGKTLINGTSYTVKGGYTKINGTSYKIGGGITKVGGTAYAIKFGRLPSGFQECEWIKGDDSSYLITSYNLKYSDTIYFKGNEFPNSSDKMFISGNYGGSGGTPNFMSVGQGYIRSEWFGKDDLAQYHTRTSAFSGYQFEGYFNKTKVHYVWGSSQATWDYSWNDSSTTISSYPISILGRRDGSRCCSAKVYYVYITDSTQTKVLDLIPCYCTTSVTGYKGSTAVSCSAGTIGLFDLVNSRFYVNSGSGSFTKGADV